MALAHLLKHDGFGFDHILRGLAQPLRTRPIAAGRRVGGSVRSSAERLKSEAINHIYTEPNGTGFSRGD